jgi:5-methylcytosine-specific restriction endonuclease McrA
LAAQKVYALKWWKKNPGKRRIYNHNRRFKYGTGKAGYSVADIDDIFNMQGGRCAYCRTELLKEKFHVDHIMPVSKGGSNLRSNLQILCKKCNQAKSFLDPIIYARSVGLLL